MQAEKWMFDMIDDETPQQKAAEAASLVADILRSQIVTFEMRQRLTSAYIALMEVSQEIEHVN